LADPKVELIKGIGITHSLTHSPTHSLIILSQMLHNQKVGSA
jgi:hypothetical protein